MAKNKGEGKFKTWWKGLKSEFSKIIWLNRKTVIKQTAIVIVVTIIVGVIITIIDFYSQLGLKQIVSQAIAQETTTAVENQVQTGAAPSATAVQKATKKAKDSKKSKTSKKADTKKTNKKSNQ